MAVNVLLRSYLGGCLDGILVGEIRWSGAAVALGVGFAASIAASCGKSRSVQQLQHSLRGDLYRRAYGYLLWDYQGEQTLGEFSSVLSNDVTAVVNGVNRVLSKLLSDGACFLLSVGVIAAIHPVIALAAVLGAAVPAGFVALLGRRQKEQRQQYMQELEQVNRAASDGLFSLEAVKADALEARTMVAGSAACWRICSISAAIWRRRRPCSAPRPSSAPLPSSSPSSWSADGSPQRPGSPRASC